MSTKSPMSAEAKASQSLLRSWRKHRKLTLARLAEQTGYAVSTLSGWETGEREVGTEDYIRLAKVYGVHPAALMMAPEVAGPKVARMIEASGLVEKMDESDARQWLDIGATIAREKPGR